MGLTYYSSTSLNLLDSLDPSILMFSPLKYAELYKSIAVVSVKPFNESSLHGLSSLDLLYVPASRSLYGLSSLDLLYVPASHLMRALCTTLVL